MKIALSLAFSFLCCFAFGQAFSFRDVAFLNQQAPVAAGGGGGNNLTFVNRGGTNVQATTATLQLTGTVTSGNSILLGTAALAAGTARTWAIGNVTKASGTATIGTVVLDCQTNMPANDYGVAIFRVPITGNGTLNLTINPGGASDMNWIFVGSTEVANLNATPVGLTNVFKGTAANATSGSITTSGAGGIFYATSENSVNTWTRAVSDTLVFKVDTASTSFTGCDQTKLITTSPNTITNSLDTSEIFKGCYVFYQSN